MNTYHLKLDLNKGPLHNLDGDYGGITLRQGDKNGCTLVVDLYDHGERFTTTGLTAFFVMELPDHVHYYSAQATYSAGTVTVQIDESYAASAYGNTVAYIELRQGTTIVASTREITVRILRDAREGKTAGETYDSEIAEALAELAGMATATTAATNAAVSANNAATAASSAASTANTAAARAESAVAHNVNIWFEYDGGLLTLCTTEGE